MKQEKVIKVPMTMSGAIACRCILEALNFKFHFIHSVPTLQFDFQLERARKLGIESFDTFLKSSSDVSRKRMYRYVIKWSETLEASLPAHSCQIVAKRAFFRRLVEHL
jgi:hypothetical protein